MVGWLVLGMWQSVTLPCEGMTNHLSRMWLSPGWVFIYMWGYLNLRLHMYPYNLAPPHIVTTTQAACILKQKDDS